MLALFHCSKSCSDLFHHSASFFCSSCDKLCNRSFESSDDDGEAWAEGLDVEVEDIDGKRAFQ